MDTETYKKLKDVPPGAIIQVSGLGVIAKLIRWYQNWQTGVLDLPNHSAIYIGGGDNAIIEACVHVTKSKISRYFYDNYKVTALVYRPMTVDQLQVVKSNAYSSLGKPYDWKGILAFLNKKFSESKYANYCSELVARCYKWAGIKITDKPWPDDPGDSLMISPGDIQLWAVNNPDTWQEIVIWVGKKWQK